MLVSSMHFSSRDFSYCNRRKRCYHVVIKHTEWTQMKISGWILFGFTCQQSPSASQVACFGRRCTHAPANGRGSSPSRLCCGPSASVPSPVAGTSCQAPCWPPALGGGASAGCSWPRGPPRQPRRPQSALPAGRPPQPRWVWPGGHTYTPPPSCGGGPPSSAGLSRSGETACGYCGREEHIKIKQMNHIKRNLCEYRPVL